MNQSKRPVPVIYERVSVHSFQNKPVPKDVLEEILTAGTMAPTSGNMQSWEFIVIDDPEIKEKIVDDTTFGGYYSKGAKSQQWIKQAGVIIIACTNFKRAVARYGELGRDLAPLDTASAVQNMLLTATAMGLASCWVGGFHVEKLKKMLNIPIYVRPAGLVPMGYPIEKTEPKKKMPVRWVTHKNSYNVPYFKD